ncbi:pyridoxal phosphate-dependent aminotransferase [Thermovenabulum gondwanense]|uniref:Aminotransferase n=1 Tax=Thermovenabulum gondwanense TaxID=520767 RepID=A0A162M888_9FIRM|nr:pyridoxal phosphate-dependent aminotransferase [Thermovenabulum gondwanense]KYO64510.1 Aspartate aminotransferase [Thermovenabulum gondwanense]
MFLSEKAKGISPSPTLAVDSKAKQMKSEGYDVIGFGAGEPDFDTPSFIKSSAIKAINEGFTKYTPVGGIPELKKAIADIFNEELGLTYKPGEIIVSNGAKQCLYNALYCLVNPGDEVLIPHPYWVSYPELVKLCGGTPVFVPTYEKDDFKMKKDVIEPLITSKTRVIVVNSPNNPTGSVYSKKELEDIAELAIRYNLFIISDEIYDKLIYDGEKHISIATLGKEVFNRTLIVNGVSKAYSMTGWRIGYAAGPEEIVKAMTDFQSHTTSNPNSIAQKAALEALTNPERKQAISSMVEEFSKRRDYMVERINQIPGLSCIKPKGAFYVMMNITKTFGKKIKGFEINNSTDFAQKLLENYMVAVVPGIAFGTEDFVRLSYATSLKNIEKGIDRIENFVRDLV